MGDREGRREMKGREQGEVRGREGERGCLGFTANVTLRRVRRREN